MLGSTAKEDQCRVCGGDGTTCTSVQGIAQQNDFQTGTYLKYLTSFCPKGSNRLSFKWHNLPTGYNDVLLIPVGATNIKIREVKSSNNYLGRKMNCLFFLSIFKCSFLKNSFPKTMFSYPEHHGALLSQRQLAHWFPSGNEICRLHLPLWTQTACLHRSRNYHGPGSYHRSPLRRFALPRAESGHRIRVQFPQRRLITNRRWQLQLDLRGVERL